MTNPTLPLKQLYLADEVAWLDATVEQIRFGNVEGIDFANLEEFLTSMARRDRRAVISRFEILLAHILKWMFQPQKRTRSWLVTIKTQQWELTSELKLKSLRNHALDEWENLYEVARELASLETGMELAVFPELCPFTLEQALAFDADATGLAD